MRIRARGDSWVVDLVAALNLVVDVWVPSGPFHHPDSRISSIEMVREVARPWFRAIPEREKKLCTAWPRAE